MTLLSKLVIWLLSPLGTVLTLAVLALLLVRQRHLRASWAAALMALLWLWLWATPLASLWLRGLVEDSSNAVPIASLPVAQAIVVLGGAVSPPSGRSLEIDLQSAADRVWHAAKLYHAGRAPLLLLSGGGELERQAYSEARAMAMLLADLGLPAQAMLLEEKSRNTRENAAFSAAQLRSRGIERVLLVTSALHMPRAAALFAAQGLQVTAAPTDFEANRLAPPGLLAWLPDALALDGSGRAMKEIVGRWVGW
ncbi:MAG: YdcF family protein [Rhodoferax sp.]